MKEKTLPWWLVVATGLIILRRYLSARFAQASLNALTFLLAVGVLGFSIYNFSKAYSNRNDNRFLCRFSFMRYWTRCYFCSLSSSKALPRCSA
jgi:hypothetical protein